MSVPNTPPPVLVTPLGPERGPNDYELRRWDAEEQGHEHVATLTQTEAMAAFYALADALRITEYRSGTRQGGGRRTEWVEHAWKYPALDVKPGPGAIREGCSSCGYTGPPKRDEDGSWGICPSCGASGFPR